MDCACARIGLSNAPGPVLTKGKYAIRSGTWRELRGIFGTPGVPPCQMFLGPLIFGLGLQVHQHVSNKSFQYANEIPVGELAINSLVELGLLEFLPPKHLRLPSPPAHANAHRNRRDLRNLYHFLSP